MFQLGAGQLTAVGQGAAGRLSERLRPWVAEQPRHRTLAADDEAWQRWWNQVLRSAQSAAAVTPRRIAAHAMFSLWFGYRYFEDPRAGWLRILLEDDQGGLDFRRIDVDLDRLIKLAGAWMEETHGANAERYLQSMSHVARLAEHFAAGRQPEWSAERAADLVGLIWPQSAEHADPRWLAMARSGVESVAARFEHADGVRWPLMLSLAAFGMDPWTDAANHAMVRPITALVQLSPQVMAECVLAQATDGAKA